MPAFLFSKPVFDEATEKRLGACHDHSRNRPPCGMEKTLECMENWLMKIATDVVARRPETSNYEQLTPKVEGPEFNLNFELFALTMAERAAKNNLFKGDRL